RRIVGCSRWTSRCRAGGRGHPRRPSHLREEPTDGEAGGDGQTEHQDDPEHHVDDDYAAAPSSAGSREPGPPALLIECRGPPPASPPEQVEVGCSRRHPVEQRVPPPHSSGKRCSTSSATAYAVRGPLRDQALVAVEHHRSQPLPALQRLTHVRERDYGATRLTFLRYV